MIRLHAANINTLQNPRAQSNGHITVDVHPLDGIWTFPTLTQFLRVVNPLQNAVAISVVKCRTTRVGPHEVAIHLELSLGSYIQ